MLFTRPLFQLPTESLIRRCPSSNFLLHGTRPSVGSRRASNWLDRLSLIAATHRKQACPSTEPLEIPMIEMRMDQRCALITGGSMGIGYAAAMNFARAGASVAICARRPDVLEEARQSLARAGKGRVVGIAGDVSKAQDCARIFATAEQELGR